jgi:hypothetical protein
VRHARTIEILHPDYLEGENTLLVFRALGDDDGIDHDTALAACGIIAGNIWTGFLATRNGDNNLNGTLVPVARPADGILRAESYYFQLPDAHVSERPYPVVVRFSDWCFPHRNLPPPWSDVGSQEALSPSCRLTDAGWGVEKAHLVPLSVQPWWIREGLGRYTITDRFSQPDIDADDNMIMLRSDMHKLFDEKVFAIVPKRDAELRNRSESGEPQAETSPNPQGPLPLSLVTHIFNPISDAYFNATYHNRKLLPFRHSFECLFARFAWTLFSPGVIGRFLTQCLTERRVLIFDPARRRFGVETRNSEQTHAIYRASQSRSASPRKRGAGEMAGDCEPAPVHGDGEMEDQSPADSGFAAEASPGRGRPRKRRCEGSEYHKVSRSSLHS